MACGLSLISLGLPWLVGGGVFATLRWIGMI